MANSISLYYGTIIVSSDNMQCISLDYEVN